MQFRTRANDWMVTSHDIDSSFTAGKHLSAKKFIYFELAILYFSRAYGIALIICPPI